MPGGLEGGHLSLKGAMGRTIEQRAVAASASYRSARRMWRLNNNKHCVHRRATGISGVTALAARNDNQTGMQRGADARGARATSLTLACATQRFCRMRVCRNAPCANDKTRHRLWDNVCTPTTSVWRSGNGGDRRARMAGRRAGRHPGSACSPTIS